MRGVLSEIVGDVNEIVKQNHKSVQFLAEIDQAKGRVEHASKTLSEVKALEKGREYMEMCNHVHDAFRSDKSFLSFFYLVSNNMSKKIDVE